MGATAFGALYSDLYDPPFPFSPLGTMVELYLGPVLGWTDISRFVYQRAPIAITDGRPDEQSQFNPSQCTLTLNNRNNWFSINNPTGPYWGLLTRNTPLRVSVPTSVLPAPYNGSYLRMEDDAASSASCASAAQLEISGPIDVRVDVDITSYTGATIAYRWGGSWQLGTSIYGQLSLRYTPDGINSFTVTSSLQTPLPVGRQVVRFTFDTAAQLITFYTAAPGNIDTGPWMQLGAAQPIPSAATLNPGTVGVGIGLFYGAVYDMELRNGIGGAIVARAAFNTLPAGTTSWTDSTGLSWSLTGTAEISARSYRYHGELSQTPKAADPTGLDVYSQATASGVLRRLQQAQSPVNSALYRAYVRATGASMPAAYWPCEDQALSTQLASGLPGGTGMRISGTPQLASNTNAIGSAALPALNGATLRGTVPQGSTWTVNEMQFVASFPASPTSETNSEIVASLFTTGTVARMDLQYGTAGAGTYVLVGYNSAGTQLFTSGPLVIFDGVMNGNTVMFGFGMQVVSGTPQWQLWSGVPSTDFVVSSGTVAGATLGAVTSVAINPGGQCQEVSVGHVAVVPGTLNVGAMFDPFNAWGGETAAARVQRLCTEEGEQVRVYGHHESSIQMGPQTMQTLTQLLQECETTDRGMLFEPMTCLGLGYRPLFSMYNQSAKASADYSAAQLSPEFGSTADDLLSLNDVTVTNLDGSSARVVLATGTMSIQPPPTGIGRVDTSIQVNTLSDDYLADVASWILHVSTDAHDRFPTIPFNLANTRTPTSAALVRVGDMTAVSNPPAWAQPDEIQQLAAGRTETLGPASVWEIDINGVPAYPYLVAEVDGAGGKATHADTDGSQTAVYVGPGTAPTTWKAAADWAAWQATNATLAVVGNTLQITSSGSGTFWQGFGPTSPVTAGQTVAAVVTIAAQQALGAVQVGIHLGGGSDTYTGSTPVAVAAGQMLTMVVTATAVAGQTVWQPYVADQEAVSAGDVMTVTLVRGAVTGSLSVATTSPYPIWTTSSSDFPFDLNVGGERITAAAASGASSPQAFTVIRAVNGVVKAQATGAAVALWYTPIVGQITGA